MSGYIDMSVYVSIGTSDTYQQIAQILNPELMEKDAILSEYVSETNGIAAKFAVYDTIGRASAYFVNDGNCIFWLTTIFLVMLMATKLKTLVCVGVYMILYIIMNLMSYIDGIKYLSPLHYIVVASSNSSQIMFSTILFSIYAICVGILFTHIGIRKIEKMDL